MPDFPYPTLVEVIRACAKMFAVKSGNKELDDKARDKAIDPRRLDELKADIFENLGRPLSSSSLATLKSCFESFENDYIQIVATQFADGVTRSSMREFLIKTVVKNHVVRLVSELLDSLSGARPSTELYFCHSSSVTTNLLNWLEQNETRWTDFVERLNKENKAKVKAWRLEEHIPDIQSITLISRWSDNLSEASIDWPKIKLLLLLGATADRLLKENGGEALIEECRMSCWGAEERYSLSEMIEIEQTKRLRKFKHLLPVIGELQLKLDPKAPKQDGMEKSLTEKLDWLAAELVDDNHTNYWIDWYRARLSVFTGDLDSANDRYKAAFDDSLYRAGINQKFLIEEALVVSASLPKPDRVFLKHLKNALINFKYDIPSVLKKESSNKFSDVIEDWEVELWKASFHRVFPKVGLFSAGKMPDIQAKVGPLIFDENKAAKISPTYNRPNRRIKMGETWQKTWPQLVWFTERENTKVVQKLLEHGADVNLVTSSGESAILMALTMLDVIAIPYVSLDESLFEVISEYPHKSEVLNSVTAKKRLLPLILAVKSGKLNVVQQVINMGADVNQRGETDSQTALNVCLKLIGMTKNMAKYIFHQKNMPLTLEGMDSIRRFNPGLTGFTLEDQARFIAGQNTHSQFPKIEELVFDVMAERVMKFLSLTALRQIASLLIDHGAEVNALHTSPVNGYTPLMLAAELDEALLFNKMLGKRGDPSLTYFCQNTGRDVDCWRIAELFKSREVEDALKYVEPYYPNRIVL